jgi:putative tryptophan/tyrosine transport system substrate-binding protein
MSFDQLRRREFVAMLGAAATWPLAARAQQPAMPIIGYLDSGLSDLLVYPGRHAAFRQALSQAGFVEGRNLAIEYRWADGRNERLPALAAELVRRPVAAIYANGVAAALAAKAATQAIPIIFQTGGDPVQLGLVDSFNRPGGNLTGLASIGNALQPKQLEVLHDLLPAADLIAFLVNPSNPNAEPDTKALQSAAGTVGPQILALNAVSAGEIDIAFATLVQRHAGALLVELDPLFQSRSNQIVALAIRHAVPAVASYREFAVGGGLMSYGSNADDNRRLSGNYLGRVLKGEKPADLPIVQPTKLELVINLQTAKTIGLDVPLFLQQRADEVVE